MVIPMKEAIARISSKLLPRHNPAAALTAAQDTLCRMVVQDGLNVYAESGAVLDHIVYPPDAIYPAREIHRWYGNEKIMGIRAIFSSDLDFDMESNALSTWARDTRIIPNNPEAAFPEAWRGACVVVKLTGVSVDQQALDNLIAAQLGLGLGLEEEADPAERECKRRGRKPTYDWAAFETEARRKLDEQTGDGVQAPPASKISKRSKLEMYMIDWCRSAWGEAPSRSSIRYYIRRMIRCHYPHGI